MHDEKGPGDRTRLVVTGARGKLGRAFVRAVAQHYAQSVEISALSRAEAEAISGLSAPARGRGTQEPAADAIVALWGVTSATQGKLDDNARYARIAADVAQHLGARRVLHCSSAAVYGLSRGPNRESDPIAPADAYGASKAEMERVVQALPPGGAEHILLRIGNVAGADSLFGNGFARGAIRLDCYPDGQGPLRSYIGPDDLAHVLVRLCRLAPGAVPPILNVAAPHPVRMQDLAARMGWPVTWQPCADPARQALLLETSLLQGLVDLGPQASDPGRMVAGLVQGGDWP